MEPGWQRNVVIGVVFAVWVAGFGLLEVDDGGRFMDGVVTALYVGAVGLPLLIAPRITSLRARFMAVLVAVAAVTAAFQLAWNGEIGWLWMGVTGLALASISVAADLVARLRQARRPV